MNRKEWMRTSKFREGVQFPLGKIIDGASGERAVTAYPCGCFPL